MVRVLLVKKFRVLCHFLRNISSEIVNNELNNGTRREIEEYWAKRLQPASGSGNFHAASVLYPATTIHSENLKLLAIRDSTLRYHQMNDCQVRLIEYWPLHPHLDAGYCGSFTRLKKLVVDTKAQLEQLRLAVSSRELCHSSADFCQRSQYLFLKLYSAGLIYRRKTLIDDDGARVENKRRSSGIGNSKWKVSEQWFLKTTKFVRDFSEKLNARKGGLDSDLDCLHKSWTGKCDGFSFDWSTDAAEKLNIWVPNLSMVPQAEFLAVKPNSLVHHLCRKTSDPNGKLKIKVINPVTSKALPVYVAENLEYPFGRDARLGVPSESAADREFAEEVGLPANAADAGSVAEESGVEFDRVDSQHGDWPITQTEVGGARVPLVYCDVCGFQPVPEGELPITMPPLPEDLRSRDSKAIQSNRGMRMTCSNCGGQAELENTFIDPVFLLCLSSFETDDTNKLVPVDLFTCGGNEAAYQLYLTKFLSHILHYVGLCPAAKASGRLLFSNSSVNQITSEIGQENCLEFDQIIKKASARLLEKSEFNESILDEIRDEYGCDFSHLLLLLSSESEQLQLDQSVQTDILIWQNNLWLTIREFLNIRERPLAFVSPWIDTAEEDANLKKVRNESIRLATLAFSETFELRECISILRKLTNKLRMYTREARKLSIEYEKSLSALIIMLTPIMPHFAATLWKGFTVAEGRLTAANEGIAWNEDVMLQKWPKMDEDYEVPVTLRINSNVILTGGLVRCNKINQLTVDEALDIAKKSRDVRKFLNKNHVLDIYLHTVGNLQAELIVVAESNTKTEKNTVRGDRAKNKNL